MTKISIFSPFLFFYLCFLPSARKKDGKYDVCRKKREDKMDAEGERTAFDAVPETGKRAWANFHMRDVASS